MRYLLRTRDIDTGTIISEKQYRTLKEALHFYDKTESALLICIGDTQAENKVLYSKGYN